MNTIMLSIVNKAEIVQIVTSLLVILLSFPVHECAHAWVAYKLGDYTGKNSGRITLNPKVHIELWGALMLFVMGVGYAKPVPVNQSNLRRPKRDFAIISLAGPLSNLILALLLLLVAKAIEGIAGTGAADTEILSFILACLRDASYVNVCLAVFNMLPIPPLDGFSILIAIVPDRFYSRLMGLKRNAVYALLGLFLVFNLVGTSPITSIAQKVFYVAEGILDKVI